MKHHQNSRQPKRVNLNGKPLIGNYVIGQVTEVSEDGVEFRAKFTAGKTTEEALLHEDEGRPIMVLKGQKRPTFVNGILVRPKKGDFVIAFLDRHQGILVATAWGRHDEFIAAVTSLMIITRPLPAQQSKVIRFIAPEPVRALSAEAEAFMTSAG